MEDSANSQFVPPPGPQKSWFSRHMVLGYAFLFVAFAGVVGGVYWYQHGRMQPAPEQSLEQKDETASWKTYTNAQYGFEFRYPPDFAYGNKVLIEGDHYSISGPRGDGDALSFIEIMPADKIRLYYQEYFSASSLDDLTNQLKPHKIGSIYNTVTKEFFNTNSGERGIKVTESYEDKEFGKISDTYFLFYNNARVFQFTSAQTALSRVSEIVKTFRFIDSTDTSSTPRADELVTLEGSQSIFLNFPKRFFDESIVADDQILAVVDAQYQSLKKMHNGLTPYVLTKIEYDPVVYGMTTPEGIKLGDSAFPSLNNGNPRWEVMAHEQGHNFFGATSAFYYSMASPGPFLQESFAVLSAFYTYNDILKNAQKYGIKENTLNSLRNDFKSGRDYQKQQYEIYIKGGAVFDVNSVLTSQALDYLMILKGEQYGWNNYESFTRAFDNQISNQFTFQNDGVSNVERSTYVIAALNVAFNNDFQKEFISLNFPIDRLLYNEIFNKIGDFITNGPSYFHL